MAVPVINPSQSVLGYLQNEKFAFQPFATNSPTWWSASPLPDGITLNPFTGLISGAAKTPGVYVVGVSASNTPFIPGIQQVLTLTYGGIGDYHLTVWDPTGAKLEINLTAANETDITSALYSAAQGPNSENIATTAFIWQTVWGSGTGTLTCTVPGVCTPPTLVTTSENAVTVTTAGMAPSAPVNPTWSTTAMFTFGIEAGAEDLTSNISAGIDLITRTISFDGQSSTSGATVGPALSVKRGDDVVFLLRFLKGGVVIDLDLTSLKFGLKEIETDNLLLTGDAWIKTGTAETARYKLHVKFASDALVAALSNYEADTGTYFTGFGEFEWVENTDATSPWPVTLRGSTATIPIKITRDLIPDA